jgi:hypothetical protein
MSSTEFILVHTVPTYPLFYMEPKHNFIAFAKFLSRVRHGMRVPFIFTKFVMNIFRVQNLSFHSGSYKDFHLLGYKAAYCGESQPINRCFGETCRLRLRGRRLRQRRN